MPAAFKAGDQVRMKPNDEPLLGEWDISLQTGRVVDAQCREWDGTWFYQVKFAAVEVSVDEASLEPVDVVTQLGDLVDPTPG